MIEEFIALLSLIDRVFDALSRISKWAKDHELDKWVSTLENSVDELEQAKSAQEKLSAAHNLAHIIANL